MANNVTIPAIGTGDTAPKIATNEVVDGTLGTVQVQYVKLMDGAIGGTGKASVLPGGGLAVIGYDGQTAKAQRITPHGAGLVSETTRLIGPLFNGSLSNGTGDFFWATGRGSAATAVIANSVATLTSGTTNSDWCSVNSVRNARYLTANSNFFRASLVFSAVAAANTTAYFGAISLSSGAPQNGYCFSVSGTGAVSVQSYSGGSLVLNVAAGFNGVLGSTYSVPDTNMHVWEVIYRVTGAIFLVDGQVLHSATPTNALFSGSFNLPIGLSIINGLSPTSRVITSWYGVIARYGKESSVPQYAYINANTATLCKTGSGRLHRLIIGTCVNAATVTIADNTSGTTPTLALITSGNAGNGPVSLEMGVHFNTGLYITPSATTNLTVIFE